MHIGQGFFAIKGPPEAGIDNLMILATQVSAFSAQDLLWGGAFQRWPDLKVAFSEGGIGWISFFLDRCDRHYQNQIWIGHDFGGKLPSEVFREHCLACFVTDPTALKVRHDIGMDIIAWENDYPHSDSIWPDVPESIHAEMTAAGCTDTEMEQITWGNMARFYDYDPFAHVPARAGHRRCVAGPGPRRRHVDPPEGRVAGAGRGQGRRGRVARALSAARVLHEVVGAVIGGEALAAVPAAAYVTTNSRARHPRWRALRCARDRSGAGSRRRAPRTGRARPAPARSRAGCHRCRRDVSRGPRGGSRSPVTWRRDGW